MIWGLLQHVWYGIICLVVVVAVASGSSCEREVERKGWKSNKIDEKWILYWNKFLG